MELLDHYLRAVGLYLPRSQRADILKELAANLTAELEERASDLGYPLSAEEQLEFLERHGEPMEVARRYGARTQGLAFGRQLIGPALFPLYRRVLLLSWGIAFAFFAVLLLAGVHLEAWQLWVPLVLQFTIITGVYIGIEFLQKRAPRPWNFPPTPFQPVPRWASISGLVVWCLFTTWWLLVPEIPALLVGPHAPSVGLSPAWHRLVLPTALMLLAGIAQRTINLLRPAWNLLLPLVRLPVNLSALAYSLWLFRIHTFVVATSPSGQQRADFINGSIYYGLISWLWVQCLVYVFLYAHMLYQHGRASRRAHFEQPAALAL
jgi:hypothetical protein